MKKYVNLVKLTSILYFNYSFPPKIIGSKSLAIEQTLGPPVNLVSSWETSFMLSPQCDAIWCVLKHESRQASSCLCEQHCWISGPFAPVPSWNPDSGSLVWHLSNLSY